MKTFKFRGIVSRYSWTRFNGTFVGGDNRMLPGHPVHKQTACIPIGFSRVCKLVNVRYVFMGSYPRARVQGE